MKCEEDNIINEQLTDSILNNSTRDFWSQIKRIRSNGSGTSRIVDGQTESISITKLFADKFQQLYIGFLRLKHTQKRQ